MAKMDEDKTNFAFQLQESENLVLTTYEAAEQAKREVKEQVSEMFETMQGEHQTKLEEVAQILNLKEETETSLIDQVKQSRDLLAEKEEMLAARDEQLQEKEDQLNALKTESQTETKQLRDEFLNLMEKTTQKSKIFNKLKYVVGYLLKFIAGR